MTPRAEPARGAGQQVRGHRTNTKVREELRVICERPLADVREQVQVHGALRLALDVRHERLALGEVVRAASGDGVARAVREVRHEQKRVQDVPHGVLDDRRHESRPAVAALARVAPAARRRRRTTRRQPHGPERAAHARAQVRQHEAEDGQREQPCARPRTSTGPRSPWRRRARAPRCARWSHSSPRLQREEVQAGRLHTTARGPSEPSWRVVAAGLAA